MNHDQVIAQAELALAEAKKAKRSQMENVMVPCTECNAGNRVGDMTVSVHEHYIEPYGCTGGDYWTSGDGSVRSFLCPHCGTTNRLFGNHNPNSLYWLVKDFVKHIWVKGEDARKKVNSKF